MMYKDLIKKRYSVRSYDNQKVEAKKVQEILEAGNIAPTGANKQPYKVLAIQSDEGLEKIKAVANTYNAPLVLVICKNESQGWKRVTYDNKNIAEIDASIVTDHMMLQATDLGLGSLWICHFDPVKIKKLYNIPDELEPLNILAIGYTYEKPESPDRHATKRKGLEKTVVYDSF